MTQQLRSEIINGIRVYGRRSIRAGLDVGYIVVRSRYGKEAHLAGVSIWTEKADKLSGGQSAECNGRSMRVTGAIDELPTCELCLKRAIGIFATVAEQAAEQLEQLAETLELSTSGEYVDVELERVEIDYAGASDAELHELEQAGDPTAAAVLASRISALGPVRTTQLAARRAASKLPAEPTIEIADGSDFDLYVVEIHDTRDDAGELVEGGIWRQIGQSIDDGVVERTTALRWANQWHGCGWSTRVRRATPAEIVKRYNVPTLRALLRDEDPAIAQAADAELGRRDVALSRQLYGIPGLVQTPRTPELRLPTDDDLRAIAARLGYALDAGSFVNGFHHRRELCPATPGPERVAYQAGWIEGNKAGVGRHPGGAAELSPLSEDALGDALMRVARVRAQADPSKTFERHVADVAAEHADAVDRELARRAAGRPLELERARA